MSQTTLKRKKTRSGQKGRMTQPAALELVNRILGDASNQREFLIEHLHAIQDHQGYLSFVCLRALAERMNLPMAAVYETASFYAHFDIVRDDETPPPSVTIRVCDSLSCQLAGAEALSNALKAELDPQEVRVIHAPCMGRCDTAPVVELGHHHIQHADVEKTKTALSAQMFEPSPLNWQSLSAYQSAGGYQLLQGCRNDKVSVESLIVMLEKAGLRGLGGAGFPTFKKWQFVRAEQGPRYCVINADEGEPGTFKDRYYLEKSPHQFLEGTLISAWAIDAIGVYIYLRDEYPGVNKLLTAAILELENAALITPGYIQLRRGAGAYICGEESALIESLEGKPGKPRHRPPFVAQKGLFDRPTLVNNVETVYWIPEIHHKGADWFASHGRHGRQGLRSFSVSGRVNKPGVHLAPAGITLQELIDEYCGGMLSGHQLLGYLPGGASGGILPASKANIPLDFDTLQAEGCFIGSAAVIVLSDQDNLQQVARNLMAFFRDESCGQCTPCRVGTDKMLSLIEAKGWDVEQLHRLSQVMMDASICGLGQAAPNPVLGLLRDFKDELTASNIILRG